MRSINAVKAILRIHKSNTSLIDEDLDKLLKIETRNEKKLTVLKLVNTYGNEDFDYQGAKYEYIRQIFRIISPKKDQTFYDFGSGYGRVILYGAIVSPGKFKGIEIIKERARISSKAIDNLGLKNVTILNNNILDCEIDDGDIFFLFNPFYKKTLNTVFNRLHNISKTKKIVVISYSNLANPLFLEKWLRKSHEIIFPGYLVEGVTIYDNG